jgi:hypothetical protein
MHRRLIPIAVSALAAAIVAGVLVAGGASAAPKAGKHSGFQPVLATKLGAELNKPAADVRAALKAAKPERRTPGAKRSQQQRAAKQRAWTEGMAQQLKVEPAAVTAAVQALVKERLDSLVQDGWLTASQRDKRLANGKLGLGFLRIGGR